MSAAYTNLYIEQGTTFNTSIALDDVYGNSYNLQNFSVSSQIRKSYYSSSVTASFTTSINPTAGAISLTLNAPTTANISPGRYVYDTILIDSNNNVTRILEGIVEVSPSVTR
jgi:hypothetical protein